VAAVYPVDYPPWQCDRHRRRVPGRGARGGSLAAEGRSRWPLPAAQRGKSTLLNRLAGRRALARVSKTPGRTRGSSSMTQRALAGTVSDLLSACGSAGLRYAQVSRDERKAWQRLVEGYVKARSSLRLFLILLDARRAPGEEEIQLVEWLRSERVPHHLVVTKTDKLRTPSMEPPRQGACSLRTRRTAGVAGFGRNRRGWTRCGLLLAVYATAGQAVVVYQDDGPSHRGDDGRRSGFWLRRACASGPQVHQYIPVRFSASLPAAGEARRSRGAGGGRQVECPKALSAGY